MPIGGSFQQYVTTIACSHRAYGGCVSVVAVEGRREADLAMRVVRMVGAPARRREHGGGGGANGWVMGGGEGGGDG